jgi:site-specific DNA-methyltransferase (adenine-specific)
MKPFDGSFSNNARKWGVAGLHIDECRIGKSEGRFPANVILDDNAAKLLDQQSPIRKNGKYQKSGKRDPRHKGKQLYGGGIGGGNQNAPDCYGDAGGASRFF